MTHEPALNGRAAVFFDLDGTLLPGPSLERRFLSELRRNNKIPLINYFYWSLEALRLLPKGILAIQHGNKRYLTGVYRDLVFQYMESISFFEEGIARVAWHARQEHEIVLVSGTLEPLAELAASALECELELRNIHLNAQICATGLLEVRGQWTGRLSAEAMQGPAKARAVEAFAKQHQIDLLRSNAYGNNLLDRHFLSAVGYAHAVNPGREFAALANKRNWPVWHWYLEKQIAAQHSPNLVEEIHHIEERA